MKKMTCVLALLVGIVSIVSADYHSKQYGILINLEVTSVHDDETTIRITDKTIEIMGNSVSDGRIVLNIIQRTEANGQIGFIVERNGVGYSIILPEPKRAPPAGSFKAIPAGALMFWYFNEA